MICPDVIKLIGRRLLMWYSLDSETIRKKEEMSRLEWSLSNGLGGYASGPVSGQLFRKQHGLLVASLEPPVRRVMAISKIIEEIHTDSGTVSLEEISAKTSGPSSGLVEFCYERTVKWKYRLGNLILTKEIAPLYGKNAVAINYRVYSPEIVKLVLTPWFAFREHSQVENMPFAHMTYEKEDNKAKVYSRLYPGHVTILSFSQGEILPTDKQDARIGEYDLDRYNGDDRSDCFFTPCKLVVTIPADKETEIGLVGSMDETIEFTANEIIRKYSAKIDGILNAAKSCTTFEKRLWVSAEQFIAKKAETNATTILAGLPWFSDWGRDTMIALPGLLLSTGKFKMAKEVLLSFSRYLKNGLIPNVFPNSGAKPLYNTVDASLWYIIAIYRYFAATGDLAIIKRRFYPDIAEILAWYEKGTDFHIRMDSDGLISAGSGSDQITWMDVKIDDKPITPRQGKPVEINALWYNSLMIAVKFSSLLGIDGDKYLLMAETAKNSFVKRFWNQKTGCLFDVVDPDDPSIRPNQLYAISLPFDIMPKKKAISIWELAKQELEDIYGIRTLSLYNDNFKPEYSGSIDKRDRAYHMGTSWGFLFGVYLEACLRVNDFSTDSREYVRHCFLRLEKELEEGCLNGYAEIFDGQNGEIGKGCYNQAWSVGEILRIYHDYGFGKEVTK